ncbi:hypothetical protein H072_5002 [Dactylellina haptotyla CBS 200.50]|uniref:F-box domain-containing protein n=1 Tax=Dactylellina haptotyla (strain CBS 200.50) TaxID=1284197 RepID=S8AJ03_DACHA|nr:hypothetical protein H072_5002 [Dactylellina haptotyla CBS 200.50]
MADLPILPPEIISQILSELPTWGSRYNCLFVSRGFHDLVKSTMYRDLHIPFIIHDRLVTLIRTVRRNAYLGIKTKSISLGEDPYDPHRSVERIIGANDITKLFPNLKRIELFAMTFERTMLYRFFAYCARTSGLEELVLHYPDLVPLVQKMGALKKLTWSFTSDDASPVLLADGSLAETEWIQAKWLDSLAKCCPELETLTVGSVNSHAGWGISDRTSVEYDDSMRDVVGPVKLEKLKEFNWVNAEGQTAAKCWAEVPTRVLDEHETQLESIRWDFGNEYGGVSPDLFLGRIKRFTALKKLEIRYTLRAIWEFRGDPWPEDGPDINLQSTRDLLFALSQWDPRGLQEFRIRFPIMGGDCEGEIKILQQLQRAKNLKVLEMTWGLPLPTEGIFRTTMMKIAEDTTFYHWYFNEAKMAKFLRNIPESVETLIINFDGKHDTIDAYRQEQFERSRPEKQVKWKEEVWLKVQAIIHQKKTIPRAILFDRAPNLQNVYFGGYTLVEGGDTSLGLKSLSLSDSDSDS